MPKNEDSDSMADRSNVSVCSEKDQTPTSLDKSMTLKFYNDTTAHKPHESMGFSSQEKTLDKSFQSRLRSISRVYSDKSFPKDRRGSQFSQNDSKSIINDDNVSLNDSYVEDLANLQELRHMSSNNIVVETKIQDNSDDDVSFTRILEVDEEYINSN